MSSSNKGWIWGILGLALVLAFWKFFVAIAVVAIIALIAYGIGLSTAEKNSDDETGIKEISAPSQNLMLPPAQPHYHPHPQSQYGYGTPNSPLHPQGIPFDQGNREQGWVDPHSQGPYPRY